jgi:hypothetical protein
LVGGTLGQLLTALVTAGAVAAFLSTSSGLTVSVAGVLSQDMLRGSVRDFRLAAAVSVAVPFVLSLGASSLAIADVVGLAFAVAAVLVLPTLLLWHLVARADRRRGHCRAAHRRRAGHRRGDSDDRRRRPRRLGRGAARAAGRLDRAGGVRRDGAGVAPRPAPGGTRRGSHHGPAARA